MKHLSISSAVLAVPFAAAEQIILVEPRLMRREEAAADQQRARLLTRISQVGSHVFRVIYGLIGLEFVLQLLGARPSSGFKTFLDMATWPLLGSFRGVLADDVFGSMRVTPSYLVAGVHGLVHLAVLRLLKILARRQVRI